MNSAAVCWSCCWCCWSSSPSRAMRSGFWRPSPRPISIISGARVALGTQEARPLLAAICPRRVPGQSALGGHRLLRCGLIAGFIAIINLFIRAASNDAVSNMDISIYSLMREMRNAPADGIMILVTMLGDTVGDGHRRGCDRGLAFVAQGLSCRLRRRHRLRCRETLRTRDQERHPARAAAGPRLFRNQPVQLSIRPRHHGRGRPSAYWPCSPAIPWAAGAGRSSTPSVAR